jgi:hypothetical protein
MNTKKQGDSGMGAAIALFTAKGQTISIPLTDSQDYDLIVEVEGKLLKVQAKTSGYKRRDSSYTVTLETSGGNRSGIGKKKPFDAKKVDLLFILCENGDEYLIPSEEITNTKTITVGNLYKEFLVGRAAETVGRTRL